MTEPRDVDAADERTVSVWIEQLKRGDEEAARQLWDRYFQRLVNLAKKRLNSVPRRTFDEEDVALSALKSMCRGAKEGRFPELTDRNEFWKLLVSIAHRKCVGRIRHETAQKRGGGGVRGGSVLANNDFSVPDGFEQFAGEDPTPEILATIVEQHEMLFQKLPEDSLRRVAQLKLDGYTIGEIAQQTNLSNRSIQRKLRLIMNIWAEELQPPD